MKKITLKFALLFGLFSVFNAKAQNLYQFDLNYNSGAVYQTAGNWNAVNATNTTASVANFIDSNGVASTYTAAITAPFVAANDSGTQNPSPSIGFPSTATRDAFYVQNGATNSATFTFSNLNLTNYYSFSIFASRDGVTDNRETLYTITGSTTGTATLNPSSNSSNLANVNNIQAKPDGTITLTITKGSNNVNGSGFAYINAFKITESPTMLAVKDLNNLSRKINVFPNPISNDFYLNLSKSYKDVSLEVYSLDGKLVKKINNLSNVVGKVKVENTQLKSGNYLLKINADGETSTQKIIVE